MLRISITPSERRALGNAPLLARTRAGRARALIAHGRPEHRWRAQNMLEQTDEVAERRAELAAMGK
jgi:HEAT repeat protein